MTDEDHKLYREDGILPEWEIATILVSGSRYRGMPREVG